MAAAENFYAADLLPQHHIFERTIKGYNKKKHTEKLLSWDSKRDGCHTWTENKIGLNATWIQTKKVRFKDVKHKKYLFYFPIGSHDLP